MLDIDGVIADFYKGFAEYLNSNFGCKLDPYTEPSDYYMERWPGVRKELNLDMICHQWVKSGGFGSLPAMSGSKKFASYLFSNYDVYITTARIGGDWKSGFSNSTVDKIKLETLGWLKTHGYPANNVHFYHNKVSFCLENNIGFMVEDKLETALEAANNDIFTILISHPYNESKRFHHGIIRVNNFDHAIRALEALVKLAKIKKFSAGRIK